MEEDIHAMHDVQPMMTVTLTGTYQVKRAPAPKKKRPCRYDKAVLSIRPEELRTTCGPCWQQYACAVR